MPDRYDVDQLLYCSLAAPNLEEHEIDEIVRQAQAKNQAAQITGMLMVHQGIFLQWIEGPRHAVEILWRKLLLDPRHYCIVKLITTRDRPQRSFADWSMQLVPRDYVLELLNDAREAARYDKASPWAPAMDALMKLVEGQEPQQAVRALHNIRQTGA